MIKLPIDPSWRTWIEPEIQKPYMLALHHFLQTEQDRHQIFPLGEHIFKAFDLTPYASVKIVVLGQDPYHAVGQANGLAFSVPENIPIPPSLKNIYKELCTDIPEFIFPAHGNLSRWAEQGVLLLNATLTVRENQASSHQNRGWEVFTSAVISKLSAEKSGLVFMLWGKYAQQKAKLIDSQRHQILEAAHPSPLSAYRGFFGCRHFSKANLYLQSQGLEPICWQV